VTQNCDFARKIHNPLQKLVRFFYTYLMFNLKASIAKGKDPVHKWKDDHVAVGHFTQVLSNKDRYFID
jgi:hypothetical protein